jgi:O-antigen/teichoic acid export membrane protein
MKSNFSINTIVRSLFQNSLSLNTLRLLSGNLFIQVISFLTLPVFARIYLPSDYGVWGIFIFFSGLLSVVMSLRYEMSIMIPTSEHEAALLLRISKTIAFITAALFFIITIIFSKGIASFFKLSDPLILFMVPLHAYFTSYNNSMSQWISRKKHFKQLTFIRVTQSLLNIVLSLYFGYVLHWHFWGLILATAGSVLISDLIIGIWTGHLFFTGFIFRAGLLKRYIGKYINFLYYSTPFALLNFYTLNILSSILQVNYGAIATGLYTNASRLMNTPLSLISTSFSTVFYQHFSRSENKSRVLLISFIGLFIVFTSLLLPLIIWGEDLISWYLGENWRASAKFIKLLSIVTIMSFSTSSISTIFSYYQKEIIVLVWQILYLTAVLLVFNIYKTDFTKGILMYSVTGGIAYFILFISGYFYVTQRAKR